MSDRPNPEQAAALREAGIIEGPSYIGKDILTEIAEVIAQPPVDQDLVAKMRQALLNMDRDAPLAERIRKLNAVKDEHEVQQRAKAYRQVAGLNPTQLITWHVDDEDASGYLWDTVKSLGEDSKLTIRREGDYIKARISQHGPEYEVG